MKSIHHANKEGESKKHKYLIQTNTFLQISQIHIMAAQK